MPRGVAQTVARLVWDQGQILEGGRVAIAALSVGLAQACLDASLSHAIQRRQFGEPIARFQATQFKLADMATQIELSRLMTWRAAAY